MVQTVWIWSRVGPVSDGRFRYRCASRLLSVVGGCIRPMACAPTDTTIAMGGEVVRPQRRGKSKAPNFKYTGPVSVIRLELDVSDPLVQRRLERQWEAVFRLRRALQRDAQARCRAYGAAHHERRRDPKALRERLGLSRKGMEAAAKAHIEASGWMRDHLTKAVGLHVADEVWETVDRHLFADCSGRRHGPPRIGSWWEFARIPGRARSHTKATPTWESYRLVGTLDGHLAAYRHPGLPAAVSTPGQAACRPGSSILAQPSRLAAPVRSARGSWADHAGALAVVFTGLSGGDLVLPVRLPQGGGQWAHLCHFLADPQHLAQDRPGTGARSPSAGRLALLRAPADPSSGLPISGHPGSSRPDPRSPASRGGRKCVQPGGGVIPRRSARAAGHRPDRLHTGAGQRRAAGNQESPGPAASVG
jgi:hypothetical protein